MDGIQNRLCKPNLKRSSHNPQHDSYLVITLLLSWLNAVVAAGGEGRKIL